MTTKQWVIFDLVKSILYALLFPGVCFWLFFADPKYYIPVLKEFDLISNYEELWFWFRTKISIGLIFFSLSCWFAFKIIKEAVAIYKIECKKLCD